MFVAAHVLLDLCAEIGEQTDDASAHLAALADLADRLVSMIREADIPPSDIDS
jgi:hypothetical protein